MLRAITQPLNDGTTMSSATSKPKAILCRATASNVAVWNRLWDYHPTDAKDDALLAREQRSRRWAMIVHRLQATFGSLKGLRTVELGSGRGDLSAILAQHGALVTLLDASDKALEQARARFDRLGLSADYVNGDMLGPLTDMRDRFDVSLSSGVIEHFEKDDRTRVVRAHYDVIRSGGVAVISVPNAWCIPYRVRKKYQELRGWWPYGLELPYTRRELMRRAQNAGFARVEASYIRFDRTLSDASDDGAGFRPKRDATPKASSTRRGKMVDTLMGLVLLMFGWRSS